MNEENWSVPKKRVHAIAKKKRGIIRVRMTMRVRKIILVLMTMKLNKGFLVQGKFIIKLNPADSS